MTAQKGRAKNSVTRLWPFGPDLLPRLLSAIVLIPLTAIALVAGWIPFALLIALVMAGAYREWESMIAGRQSSWPTVFIMGLITMIAIAHPMNGAWSSRLSLRSPSGSERRSRAHTAPGGSVAWYFSGTPP